MIRGGTKANVVPGFCEVEIDERTLPGETTEDTLNGIKQVINKLEVNDPKLSVKVKLMEEYGIMPSMEISIKGIVVNTLRAAIKKIKAKILVTREFHTVETLHT